MKKLFFIFLGSLLPIAAAAQNSPLNENGPIIDQHFLNGLASILVLYIVLGFIVKIIRLLQDNRLKSRIIEKGVPEKVAEQLLNPGDTDSKDQVVKWICVLTGISIGSLGIHYTMPLGTHSIAIIGFSLALCLLGYFIYLKQNRK